jgi:hypothetical protein
VARPPPLVHPLRDPCPNRVARRRLNHCA